ncbi:hypothetical protein B0H34DRAFT_355469 [Crassisporium funariophilum]|nr:hypothetical protein B0H34DRAFT_355469 [Crassisporium funariophilum]
MLEKQVLLRVLYTINASPQYILARSLKAVSVVVSPIEDLTNECGSNGPTGQPTYASVSLKTCLETVCRSSPELTQDNSRDFSLYVLDPLESSSAPAPVHILYADGDEQPTETRASSQQPTGVAVGLGLMSWALAADDSDPTPVVGTLVKQGTGQEALEVIFSFRETAAMKKPRCSIQSASSLENSRVADDISIQRAAKHSHHSRQHTSSGTSKSSSQSQMQPPSTTVTRRSTTTDLTRETLASIQMRARPKVKPPKKPMKPSTIPATESDKLLNAETYIGPFKKLGRPKTTNADAKPTARTRNAIASGSGTTNYPNEVITIDSSDSDSVPTPTVDNFHGVIIHADAPKPMAKDANTKKKRNSQHQLSNPFSTGPLIRCAPELKENVVPVQPKVEAQEEPSLLDILAYLSATSSSEPNAQNTTILSALSTIDSTTRSSPDAPNSALVSALKQLLSGLCKPVDSAPSSQPSTFAPAQNDGIVVLDKENVNPTKFRKRSEKNDLKFSDPGPSVTSKVHLVTQERPVQSLGLSARSNENSLDKISLKESVLSAGPDRVARKRTLSDFMDEKESNRSREKGKEREREQVERRDGHRHSHSQRIHKATSHDSLRHYSRLLASNTPRTEQPSNYYRTGMEPWTSPPRPCVELDNTDQERRDKGSRWNQQSPRVPASSPVRSMQAQQDARKKYVVPEWARTSTSTQPRLSEEAQRLLEEAEEKKREERTMARKKSSIGKSKHKTSIATKVKAHLADQQPLQESTILKKPDRPRGPIAASNDGPLFPAANIAFPHFSSPRSSSPPPNPTSVPITPKTPVRKLPGTRPTPGRENESLFTPVMRSGSLFGSAYSQSHAHSPSNVPPTTLTSPLGNRKKAKLSSPTRGKRLVFAGAWAKATTSKEAQDLPKPAEDEESNVALEQELDNAFDDLDCPPSSLPIASSDIDIDESCPQTSGDAAPHAEDEMEAVGVTSYWAGLPPSSPPAPSSPIILPEAGDLDFQTDDEMDDVELPIATSDSETDTEMNGVDTDYSSPADSPAYADEHITASLTNDDFSAFFSSEAFSSGTSTPAMDLFDQFTNVNAQSDEDQNLGEVSANVHPELDAIFQNGLDGIDFTEFWETFKPLVDDSLQSQAIDLNECFRQPKDGMSSAFAEIDHVKLADDMQALLSGCLM